ncbi:MAG: patatin-like phospholipase family protein [Chthoniobacterales bacterium]
MEFSSSLAASNVFSQEVEPGVLRRVFPRLLGSLSEAALVSLRPHLIWDPVERAGGEVLFEEGAPSDSLYIVVSGRLQASVTDSDGLERVVGEIGRGESVGEMGTFTQEPRQATVTALRDTLLARIGLDAFYKMLEVCPELALNFNRLLIERLQRQNRSEKPVPNVVNLAVVPLADGVAAGELLESLTAELQAQGQTVLHLTSAMVDTAAQRTGAAQATAADHEAHRWVIGYLEQLEERYSLIFYEADATVTPWTLRCLRQCDEVLLLADISGKTELSEVERCCLHGENPPITARQTLLLRHRKAGTWATGTPAFLAARPRVYRHFHLRQGYRQDVARLARFLGGRAVGLVLAGGGARGLAHIGVYRALEEAGVEIDAFGGTSIGSLLAASMACDLRWKEVFHANRGESLGNPTRDVNFLPLISLLTGRKLERILAARTKGACIEELWQPFFCISSSLTRAREVEHKRGDLKRALLASMAIPGVFPPVVHGNELLFDGGLFNNLPIDVMARSGVQHIIAVDLRAKGHGVEEMSFEELPSRWQLLRDRFRPRSQRRYRVPSLVTSMIASSMLNSHRKTERLIGDVDLLFTPEVEGFGLLEWKSYDALVERGYEHARKVLAQGLPF